MIYNCRHRVVHNEIITIGASVSFVSLLLYFSVDATLFKGIGTERAMGTAILKPEGRKKSFHSCNDMPNLSAGYTQFCIAGLQESSPKEPQMHQNLAAGALPLTPLRELTALPTPLPVWQVAYRPFPRTLAQPFGLRAYLAPTMLISFRVRYWHYYKQFMY